MKCVNHQYVQCTQLDANPLYLCAGRWTVCLGLLWCTSWEKELNTTHETKVNRQIIVIMVIRRRFGPTSNPLVH